MPLTTAELGWSLLAAFLFGLLIASLVAEMKDDGDDEI